MMKYGTSIPNFKPHLDKHDCNRPDSNICLLTRIQNQNSKRVFGLAFFKAYQLTHNEKSRYGHTENKLKNELMKYKPKSYNLIQEHEQTPPV